ISSTWARAESDVFLKELDSSVRWYFARELLAPVLHGSAKSVSSDIRKADKKLFEEYGREIKLVFSEIEKARADKTGANIVDAAQLSELTRALVEKTQSHLT
ncbi:MAG: hypothetical protein V4692_02695, partial [Bdellovibrionota bacterium]